MRIVVRCIGLGTPPELDDIIVEVGDNITRSNIMERIMQTSEFSPYAATLVNGVPLVQSGDDIMGDSLKEGDYVVVMHRMLGMEGG